MVDKSLVHGLWSVDEWFVNKKLSIIGNGRLMVDKSLAPV